MVNITESAPRSAPLLIDFAGHLRKIGRAESTVETYLDVLCRLDRHLAEGLAYANTDELFREIFVEGRPAATVSLYRAAVSVLFAWATEPDNPRLDYDPSRALPRRKVPVRKSRPIPEEIFADILTRAPEPYRTWFLLALGAGLRCVEISRLDREHISETELIAHGKGDKERSIPVRPEVWAAVKDLPSGPIARRIDGGRADRKLVQGRGNACLHRLGYPAVTMHKLRHGFGTRIYQYSGKDIIVTQELLGHSSVATTMIYIDTTADGRIAAVAATPLPVSAQPAAA